MQQFQDPAMLVIFKIYLFYCVLVFGGIGIETQSTSLAG
jgi:hypothetical protein